MTTEQKPNGTADSFPRAVTTAGSTQEAAKVVIATPSADALFEARALVANVVVRPGTAESLEGHSVRVLIGTWPNQDEEGQFDVLISAFAPEGQRLDLRQLTIRAIEPEPHAGEAPPGYSTRATRRGDIAIDGLPAEAKGYRLEVESAVDTAQPVGREAVPPPRSPLEERPAPKKRPAPSFDVWTLPLPVKGALAAKTSPAKPGLSLDRIKQAPRFTTRDGSVIATLWVRLDGRVAIDFEKGPTGVPGHEFTVSLVEQHSGKPLPDDRFPFKFRLMEAGTFHVDLGLLAVSEPHCLRVEGEPLARDDKGDKS